MQTPNEAEAPQGPGTPEDPDRTGVDRVEETAEQTAAYDRLIRSAHEDWAALERADDPTVSVSGEVLSAIKRSVRAEVRRGAQVEVPPTSRGPMTVSELTLHTVLRRAVDSVPGARSLRTAFEFEEAADGSPRGMRGAPRAVTLRISAVLGTRSLPALADGVRAAAAAALLRDLAIDSVRIDVHIEDLHDQ
jgi:hypothetical protein